MLLYRVGRCIKPKRNCRTYRYLDSRLVSPVPHKENCIFNPKFEELRASGNLPSPSGVALEILKLTQSETVTIEQLVKPIKADPVLTGRVLKLVNSAAYNTGHPVLALHEAVMR